MPKFEILLSQAKAIAPDFGAAVANYIAALEAHRSTVGEPAPSAGHPFIEAAVLRVQHPTEGVHQPMRKVWVEDEHGEKIMATEPDGEPVKFVSSEKPDDFVPNFVIIDDTPPGPTLDERKAVLAQAAHAAAMARVDALDPPLKRRLAQMTVARIMRIDEADRTDADKATLAHFGDNGVRTEAIFFHLAELEAQIHDLTEATIEGWEPAPFPN